MAYIHNPVCDTCHERISNESFYECQMCLSLRHEHCARLCDPEECGDAGFEPDACAEHRAECPVGAH